MILGRGNPYYGLYRLRGVTRSILEVGNEIANLAELPGEGLLPIEPTHTGNSTSDQLDQVDITPVSEYTFQLKCTGGPRTLMEWHAALGHLSVKSMRKMATFTEGVENINFDKELGPCNSCSQGRLTRASFLTTNNAPVDGKLDLIPSDLCGPFKSTSVQGSRYFISYLDDYSGFCWIDSLPDKEAPTILSSFRNWEVTVV